MQLYLDSFGAFLAVRNGMFAVRLRSGGERAFAVRTVDAIVLTRGTGLSADAAMLAAAHGIPVVLVEAQTHFPLAQLSEVRAGTLAAVRRNQAFFSRLPAGYAWVSEQLSRKVERQRDVLRRLGEHPKAPAGFAGQTAPADRVLAAQAKALLAPLPADDAGWRTGGREATAARFRGQEGTASRLYFAQLAHFLDAAAPGLSPPFEGRAKRPAYDPFNALLNYLYGMLYTSVHLALLKAGLDPSLGVLHADQYGGAPTLAFDAIEPCRPWADAVALELAAAGKIGPEAFEQRETLTEGLWLSAAGKDAAIEAMLACLAEPTPYHGRQVKRSVQIDQDAQKLAVLLKELIVE